MLVADNLRVTRAKRVVVDGVSFEAQKGEILAVVGPNGAGKTSLLEAVCGILPRTGRVSLDGRAIETFAEHARCFSYMPDEVQPPEELSVRDAWTHALEHARAPRPEIDLGVERWMDMPLFALSRGERKRVELALALVANRPVTVLDEPFSAFDPLQLDAIFELVRGRTIIASVHQLEVAEKIADRILLLAAGRAIGLGTLGELRDQTGAASLEHVLRRLLSNDHAA